MNSYLGGNTAVTTVYTPLPFTLACHTYLYRLTHLLAAFISAFRRCSTTLFFWPLLVDFTYSVSIFPLAVILFLHLLLSHFSPWYSLALLTCFVFRLTLCFDLLCVSTYLVFQLTLCFYLLCVSTYFVLRLALCFDFLCVATYFVFQLTLCFNLLCVSTYFVFLLTLCFNLLCVLTYFVF